MYTIHEAFKLLKHYKITSNQESVRRWLRQGVIQAEPPTNRKEGWRIPKASLDAFIQARLPDSWITDDGNDLIATGDVKEKDIREQAREDMWLELANRNVFEGFVEIKKSLVRESIKHHGYSKDLEKKVWQAFLDNSKAYSRPRVFYLLEAFGFERKRLLLNKNFEDLEEQVIFAVIEYIRQKQAQAKGKGNRKNGHRHEG